MSCVVAIDIRRVSVFAIGMRRVCVGKSTVRRERIPSWPINVGRCPCCKNVQVEQSQMAITRKKAVAMVKMIPVMTWNATKALVLFLWEIIKNPRVLKDKLGEAQYHLKEVF